MTLECPNRKLHGWVKCSRTLPALNQRLYFVHFASPTQLHVTAVGQKYDPPREGNDAFLVDRKDEVPNGLPYMSLYDELQGVVLSAPDGKLANCCLPAVHIRKLLDNYRASEGAGSGK